VGERLKCRECGEEITVRKDGLLRVHYLSDGQPCPGGAEPSPKNIEQKARRYLAQARVRVVRVAPGDCEVLVYGSEDDPYRVRLVGDVWSCPCKARTWRCAHVIAATLVVPSDMSVPGFAQEPDPVLDGLLSRQVASTIASEDEYAMHLDDMERQVYGEEGPGA
jgi:uncharacterized Zn finger protein